MTHFAAAFLKKPSFSNWLTKRWSMKSSGLACLALGSVGANSPMIVSRPFLLKKGTVSIWLRALAVSGFKNLRILNLGVFLDRPDRWPLVSL